MLQEGINGTRNKRDKNDTVSKLKYDASVQQREAFTVKKHLIYSKPDATEPVSGIWLVRQYFSNFLMSTESNYDDDFCKRIKVK